MRLWQSEGFYYELVTKTGQSSEPVSVHEGYSKIALDRFNVHLMRDQRHPIPSFWLSMVALVTYCLGVGLVLPTTAVAQVLVPDSKVLFRDDQSAQRKLKKGATKAMTRAERPANDDIKLRAPKLEYLKDSQKVAVEGGVLISRSGIQAQADSGVVNTETQEADLTGGILITGEDATISAKTAQFNMDSERGEFGDANLVINEGNYLMVADRLKKLSDTEYQLFDVGLTTCECSEDDQSDAPWRITADQADITRDGYAHVYDATLRVFDIPVFYSPYIGFPVKEERQSGLLAPSLGYSDRNGTMYTQPIFITAGESTDFTFVPFIETKTRAGAWLDLSRAYSRYNKADGRLLFSDESARGTSLRGLNLDGNFKQQSSDTTPWDENRIALAYNHQWQSAPGAEVPLTFISDIHYVSDRFILKEISDQGVIGDGTDRFATSTTLLRTEISDFGSAEVMAEQNQALYSEDNSTVQQRKPEVNVAMLKSFRPFGFNPYGAKIVASGGGQFVNFARQTGYDGTRGDVNPNLALPFHLGSKLNAAFNTGMHYTRYNMDETFDPQTGTDLDDSENRAVYNFGYGMSSAVERVYGLDDGNWLTELTSTGVKNNGLILTRLKHTIEPMVRYDFVPKTQQNDLPLYDNLDRIRNRSLVTYGFTTRLMGRFLPEGGSSDPIQELTPRIEDLPVLDANASLPDFGTGAGIGSGGEVIRNGQIRDLATLTIAQSFDYAVDRLDDEERTELGEPDAFSAISSRLRLIPTDYFALDLDSDYDMDPRRPASWGLGGSIYSDRGDSLRTRYSYVFDQSANDTSINQLESGLEIVLTERLRTAYYTIYDDVESQFVENKVALRIFGGKPGTGRDCWHLDIGYADEINPDNQTVFMSFTFNGLGDISSGVWGRTMDQ